jgi:hypothetical protein
MTTTPPAAPAPTTTPSAWNQMLEQEQAEIHALISHANASGIGTTEFWLTLTSPPATFVVTLASSWAATHGLGTFSSVFSPIAASGAAIGAAWAAKEYSAARAVVKSAILDLRAKLGV